MIKNERQYRTAKAWLRRFEEARDNHASEAAPGEDPRITRLFTDAYASEAERIAAEVREYEDLRAGTHLTLTNVPLQDLPAALIRARIAAHLTQRQLAERLGMREQQIQKYEDDLYAGANLRRLQQIAEALEAGVRLEITLPKAADETKTVLAR